MRIAGSIPIHHRWTTAVCAMLIVNLASSLILYPYNTVLQISLGVSWPIEIPDQKIFMNVAFQCNYNTPNQTSNFYSAAHFPYSRSLAPSVVGQDLSALLRNDPDASASGANATASHNTVRTPCASRSATRCQRDVPHDAPETSDALRMTLGNDGKLFDVDKYHYGTTGSDDAGGGDDGASEWHGKRDMGAGELYRTFEQTLSESGLETSCLLKSVCQLARHPLHLPDGEEDVLIEMLHFVLTPSVHQSFHDHESDERARYEAAEAAGRDGKDCEMEYPECSTSLLDYVTRLEDDYSESSNQSNEIK